MKFRFPRPDLCFRFLALLLFLLGGRVQAHNIILHLRNGDRIAGAILLPAGVD